MANQVYANGMEVACKSADGKTVNIATDVCLSPPSPPAGPIPIPYPTTAMASDTDEGTKTVQISGKEVMLKNQSNFKKCTGDEAATKSLGMGVITHNITGKVYFCAWSMTVKYEGQDAVRHLDLMTHNHMSIPGDTATWPYIDMATMGADHPCMDNQLEEMHKCKKYQPYGPHDVCEGLRSPPSPPQPPAGVSGKAAVARWKRTSTEYRDYQQDRQRFYDESAYDAAENECMRARRCMLVQYTQTGNRPRCCDNKRQTPHHIVEASSFMEGRGSSPTMVQGCSSYREGNGPSICVEGTDHGTGTHGLMHTFQSSEAMGCPAGTIPMASGPPIQTDHATNYGTARESGIRAVGQVFPESNCDPDCLRSQLDAYHKTECNMDDSTPCKAIATTTSPDVPALQDKVYNNKGHLLG